MHADRTNRTVLIVLALVLLAAGGLGAAASFGLFGSGIQRRSLTDHVVADYAGRNGTWFWPVVAVAALLLVLLCLRWLLVILFSTDRAGDLEVQAEGAGRTRLSTTAVTRAVTDEIESYRGVSSADARMIGHADDLTLVVTATVEDTADLPALRERIESEALAHARAALDDPELPIQLDLTVATGQSARVQ
ncbi:alkaline shock response membrane anchor protein AmaP [Saccharomonospora azurea]|uniref:alkaline shock response membrane anchor protein AmaP n=1 Tax=Saccharomonospora azurea TaxID=40988 RepID=UPI002409301A|nr:alkaline shock response membrane anchor protein AmaP [Saccharomonospora azurea]